MSNKSRKHLSLSWSIFIGSFLFVITLCGILSAVSSTISRRVLYTRYQNQMTSIVNTAESYIDNDDLSECAKEPYTASEKYNETLEFFNKFVSYYSDLHFLYVLQPTSEGSKVVSILSASTYEEIEEDPDGVLHLGDWDPDWYSVEENARLYSIMQGTDDVFFVGTTEWGEDYTLARPLINSNGEHYALLCVDVSTETIRGSIRRIVGYSVGITFGVGAFFIVALGTWLYLSVIRPIKKLQANVSDFANSSHDANNPESLLFKIDNNGGAKEMRELSESIEKMSLDMRDFAYGMAEKDNEVKGLQVVVHSDALTGLKNRASYDDAVVRLNKEIEEGKAAFAMVMIDINNLKGINDNYGHDSGDIYIVGACEIISKTYRYSPIYRVGGDEFVVILEGKDYENREALLEIANERFTKSFRTGEEEFRRFSAALGMAVYAPGVDKNADSVFIRADKNMYQNKAKIKGKM